MSLKPTSLRASTSVDRLTGSALVHRIALASAVALTGTMVAFLVASGSWFLVAPLAMVVPAFVIAHRTPLVVVGSWLLIAPFVIRISGPVRYFYWGLHRFVPVAVVLIVVVAAMAGIRSKRVARLGWPEALMAGYVFATTLSIAYTSVEPFTAAWALYDRVFIPMCLYLLIRLFEPGDKALRALAPIAIFVIISQAVIGALSWVAPGLLLSEWLGREGTRTTGTLQSPSVYGVTMIAAGLIVLHAAATERRGSRRLLYTTMFALAQVMTVMTFTRAVWIAGAVAVIGASFVHPRICRRVALAAIPIVVVLLLSGFIQQQTDTITTRLESEESALSRLPVAYASLRMFEARPVSGWGFGGFDQFDQEFQRAVAGFQPDKDHASHNLYLTILAEQGIVGLVLYLGPAAYWLLRTISAYPGLSRSGFANRQLVVLLWLILASHIVVNMFSNMRIEYGLAGWWITLGLIGAIVSSQTERAGNAVADPRMANTGGRS